MQTTKADVLTQIRAAFPTHPIQAAGAFDERGTSYLDPVAYREHLEGKTWEQLDREYLERRTDALSFLGTNHLIAVLPAYLCIFVEQGTRTQVPDTLLLVLNRKKRRFEELSSALTPAQREAIVAALGVFAATESGQPADTARTAAERWKAC